jgi:hypothetical protein
MSQTIPILDESVPCFASFRPHPHLEGRISEVGMGGLIHQPFQDSDTNPVLHLLRPFHQQFLDHGKYGWKTARLLLLGLVNEIAIEPCQVYVRVNVFGGLPCQIRGLYS